jgi:hypothetical protein
MKSVEQLRRDKEYRVNRERGLLILVPVTVSQNHLRHLHHTYGMSCHRLGELAGLPAGLIAAIIRDVSAPMRHVRPETEAKILAVQPENPSGIGGTRTLAIGTTRRLQGLAALGYPLAWQAEQLGIDKRSLQRYVAGERKTAFFSTVLAVRGLYEKYENDHDPLAHGVTSRAMTACLHAARVNGYVKPIFWDWETLDDPEGFPDWTGKCGTPSGFQEHRRRAVMPVCAPCLKARAVHRAELRGRDQETS